MNATTRLRGALLAVSTLVAGPLLSGCAATDRSSPLEETPGYFESRARDFLDVLSVRVSTGPGLGARVAATRLAQLGLLYKGPSDPFGELLRLPTLEIGSAGREIGIWDVRSAEYGVSVWYSYEDDVIDWVDATPGWPASYDLRSPYALEASLHLGLVGASASFDVTAIGPFLLGLFGFGAGGFFAEDVPAEEDETPANDDEMWRDLIRKD